MNDPAGPGRREVGGPGPADDAGAETAVDRLARAEVSVAKGLRQLELQRRHCADCAPGSEGAASAERLLLALESFLAIRIAERDRLRRAARVDS